MNENPVGLPEDFVRAALDDLDGATLSMYPEYWPLIEKLAAVNGLCPENVCLTPGSDGAIKYLFEAFVAPGDKVLLTDPTFAMYPVYCRIFRAEETTVSYGEDFAFPVESFMAALDGDIVMAVIVNPNNPTGSVLDRDRLCAVLDRAATKDVLVIVDEAYFYYCDQTVMDEVGRRPNLVVLRTFSKLCGLALTRVGYAAGPERVVEAMHRVRPTFDVNGLGVHLVSSLLDRPEIIEKMIYEFREGKAWLAKRLERSGLPFRVGEANFVLIQLGNRAGEAARLLAEQGINVSAGLRQETLKGYLRVNIAPPPVMQAFWCAFESILARMAPDVSLRDGTEVVNADEADQKENGDR